MATLWAVLIGFNLHTFLRMGKLWSEIRSVEVALKTDSILKRMESLKGPKDPSTK